MNDMLDNSLVGLALLVSAAYAVSSLGPKVLRRRMLEALSRVTARAPAFLGLRRATQWFSVASAGKAQGPCGGCDGCGSEPAAGEKSSEVEVRVPATKIGRRARRSTP